MKKLYPVVLSVCLLLASMLIAGCNNRGRTRGRIDGSVRVDSSVPGDGSVDSTAPDTSVTFDTGVDAVDSGLPGACPIFTMAAGAGAIAGGSTLGLENNQGGSCGGDGAPEAIIVWSAPTTGTWTLDTIGSDFDTVLYVRSGTCSGTEVDCNDDSSSTQSSVTITATAGESYYIFVDGYSSNSGNFVLNATDGGA